jgi:hypothetical protein
MMKCETCGHSIEEPKQSPDENCSSCKWHLNKIEDNDRECYRCIVLSRSFKPYPLWKAKEL